MKFGTCTECDTYKYLEEDAMCPTCVAAMAEEWVVLYQSPNSTGVTEVYKQSLTEKEALALADGAPRLIIRHESNVDIDLDSVVGLDSATGI